jgi:hypothetical protein
MASADHLSTEELLRALAGRASSLKGKRDALTTVLESKRSLVKKGGDITATQKPAEEDEDEELALDLFSTLRLHPDQIIAALQASYGFDLVALVKALSGTDPLAMARTVNYMRYVVLILVG